MRLKGIHNVRKKAKAKQAKKVKLDLGRQELQRAGRNKTHMRGQAAPCARRFVPADMAKRRALISVN